MLKPPITVVSTAIWRDGGVLLGHRIGQYAAGLWCMPGGKADDPLESLDDAAKRETKEETGLELRYVRPYNLWGEYVDEDCQRYTVVYFEAHGMFAGEPRVTEPDKFDDWAYFKLDQLPGRMFDRERQLCERQADRYI